jgi:outer membrane protein, multidrug efflux system
MNNCALEKGGSRMHLRKQGVLACLGLGLLFIGGCMVGPDYKPPQTQVPPVWAGPTPPPPSIEDQNVAQWWGVFHDANLTGLIGRAFSSNLDLKLAESRIRQARAARGVAFSGLGPSVDATGSFRRSQGPGPAVTNQPGPTTNLFQTGLDAAWEFDIFGGTRRSIEAAEADWQAAIEARRNTLVTLASEVSLDYVQLRTLQQRIVIARRNLTAQQHSADLTRQRFQGGFVSGLDVANGDALVATTAAQIPLLESSVRQTIYALSLLLSLEPGALLEELTPASEIPIAPPGVPATVPSDLLRRRPDIRQSEASIHGATARIGVATADLFPRVSLASSVGLQSPSTGSLFQGNNRFWSLGPSVTWTIFDTGRILSNIEVEKALQEQSILSYRQTVLNALGEVENALIASAKEQEHRQQLTQAVAANRKAVDLSTTLYTQGQTDFLSVLDAQRSLYSSEDALAQSTGTVSTNLISLYKALGGGWEAEPAQTRPAGPPNDPTPPNAG